MFLKMKFSIIVLIFLTMLSLSAVKSSAQSLKKETIVEAKLCDLINNPDKYDGKMVRVKAVYRSFFELSELYCSECYDSGKRIWLESTKLDTSFLKSKQRKKLKEAKTSFITAIGQFQSSKSSYGHSNAYRFQLDVKSIEDVKVLSKSRPLLPSELRKNHTCY